MTTIKVMFDKSGLVHALTRAAIIKGLHDITETALTESNRTVPLLEGTLMRSGFAQVDDAELTGQVAYDTPYAPIQHEDPELHHTPPRRDHWLLRTVQENQRRYSEHMAAMIRSTIR